MTLQKDRPTALQRFFRTSTYKGYAFTPEKPLRLVGRYFCLAISRSFALISGLILCGVLLVVLTCLPAQACFGPKLFVSAGQGNQGEALFALVTLYVQEKTGVESTRVEIEEGQNPVELLSAEKADLIFVLTDETIDNTVLIIEGLPVLVTGKRPLEELQFTTVLPAIRKLGRLLEQEDVDLLAHKIKAGESAMAVARKFLMRNRWI